MCVFTINLQLFAEPTPVKTTDYTSSNTWTDASGNTKVEYFGGMTAEMKTFYDMTLIDEASANLVHDQFGQKRPIPKNGGKSIEFRKFAPLAKALTPISEGVTPPGSSLDVSTITSEVAQYGDFIVQSDVLELTAIDNTILEATKLLGRQAGLTLDTVTRNVLQASTNVSFASKWSGTTETAVEHRYDLDGTSILKVDTIRRIVAKLRACNAPTINGYYVAVIHPYAAYDLMTDEEWKRPHEYVDTKNVYAGEIGEIAGVRFVQTSEAKIFGPETGLLINHGAGYSGAITSVDFDGKLEGRDVVADELIGKFIKLGNATAKITDNTTSSITFASTTFGTIADNDEITILPSSEGAVFSTLVIANGAYGVTEITGGGLQTIVKQKGSAGTGDPLDQRSSVGWKAIKTAEILIPDYLVRVESISPKFSGTALSN